MRFEIKNRFNGKILFSVEAATLKVAIELAVKSGASLFGANLAQANLSGASLFGANLAQANLSGANLAGANLAGAQNLNPNLITPLRMLLDQPGPIRAYKLVNKNREGPFNGGIKYELGNEYSVRKADEDINNQCGEGINLATLDWCMKEWREGYRIFIAEFTARDIAAIPTATDGKFRVHKCKIVGEKDLQKIGLES